VEPNPAAIAWYVKKAQRLLEEQQRRAESLKLRGGQIAGFGAAVLALIGGNAMTILGAVEGFDRLIAGLSLLAALTTLVVAVSVAIWGVSTPKQFAAVAADEIAGYASDRFLAEPDLWRVHIRSLQALEEATREAQEDGNAAAEAIMISLCAFLSVSLFR
jgi:hypothetical protein